MRHLERALGSWWVVGLGLSVVILGVIVYGLGAPADYGWFVFAGDVNEMPIPPSRLGTEQLVGLVLIGVGLVVTAAAIGYRIGAATTAHPTQSLPDTSTG